MKGKVAKSAFIVCTLILLLGLAACTKIIPFEVQEFNSVAFSTSKMISVESYAEIVNLSSRLGTELKNAGFNIADSGDDAEYILTFEYDAEFDVFPWVIRSFTLTLTDTVSGNVIYKLQSPQPGSEPVDSLLKRIAADMSSKLLTNPMRGNVAIIGGEEDR